MMKFLLLTLLVGTATIAGAENVRARIDIAANPKDGIALTPGTATSGGFVGNASWGKTEDRKFYLTAETPVLAEKQWTKFSFSFTPEADGKITIILKSTYKQTKGKKQQDQAWVYWDNLTIEGAVVSGQTAPVVLPLAGDVPPAAKVANGLVNGSFETVDAKGNAAGWFKNAGAVVVKDKTLAQDGQGCVKVWCNANFAQNFKVKKGGKVTITGYARPDVTVPAKE